MATFPYDEEIRFVDIGSRDLVYLQQGWDPVGAEILHAEAGMWRATQDGVLAATIAQPRTAEVSEGTITAGLIVLASTNVGRAARASPLVATQQDVSAQRGQADVRRGNDDREGDEPDPATWWDPCSASRRIRGDFLSRA